MPGRVPMAIHGKVKAERMLRFIECRQDIDDVQVFIDERRLHSLMGLADRFLMAAKPDKPAGQKYDHRIIL